MTPLLRVRGLRKSYDQRNGGVQALDGVGFDICAGTTLGLVGQSGCGKSTLARCLVRLERIDSGEIWFDGQEIANLRGKPLRSLRRQIQMVFQDPVSALNQRFSVAEIVEEPLAVQGIGTGVERRARVRALIEQMGLPRSCLGKRPLELSGGQRQRLAIARALALEPRFLVLDEALASLDLSVQAQLVNLLLDLQASRSLTYLFISHDLGLVAKLADEIAVMERGRIVEHATAADLFRAPRQAGTRALVGSVPIIPPGLQMRGEQPYPGGSAQPADKCWRNTVAGASARGGEQRNQSE